VCGVEEPEERGEDARDLQGKRAVWRVVAEGQWRVRWGGRVRTRGGAEESGVRGGRIVPRSRAGVRGGGSEQRR